MQSLPKAGKMVAVLCEADIVKEFVTQFNERVSIAAHNGPTNIVVSGDVEDIDKLVEHFQALDKRCITLATSHAFHSHHMDPILGKIDEAASKCNVQTPVMPIASNLTGELADESTFADPHYWSQHARGTVQFQANFESLVAQGCNVFLEIGPQPVLIGMANRIHSEPTAAHWIPSARRELDDESALLNAVAKLYCIDADLDFARRGKQKGAAIIELPTYPFERRKYYGGITLLDRLKSGTTSTSEARQSSLLGTELQLPIPQRIFENQLSLKGISPSFVSSVSAKYAILSEAACISAMLTAARTNVGRAEQKIAQLVNVVLHDSIILSSNECKVQVLLSDRKCESFSAKLLLLHNSDEDASQFKEITTTQIDLKDELYNLPMFDEASQDVSFALPLNLDNLTDQLTTEERTAIIFDRVFEILTDHFDGVRDGKRWRIASIEQMSVSFQLDKACEVRFKTEACESGNIAASAELMDDNGEVVASIYNLKLRGVRPDHYDRLARPIPQDWLKELQWVESAIPSNMVIAHHSKVLLVGDGGSLQSQVQSSFKAKGIECDVLSMPLNNADLSVEVDDLLKSGYDAIVHCGNFAVGQEIAASTIEQAIDFGYGSVLGLVHLLMKSRRTNQRPLPRLFLVTVNAQLIGGFDAEVIRPAQGLTVGLGRVLSSEHPELNPTLFDLDVSSIDQGIDALCTEVLANSEEDQVAWRGGRRFVARLGEASSLATERQFDFEANQGTVLVTGGLGGLGLELAKSLVNRGAKSIALVSRSKPNEKANDVIQSLTHFGTTIRSYSCDISDAEQVNELIKTVDAELGPVDQIYHLAGLLDDALVRDQSVERLRKVIASKVLGAIHLHRSTADRKLRNFVMFSSVAAIAGSPGQANYAAANAFLDCIAFERRRNGLAATSINWGSWSDVGMAANLQLADHQRWEAAGVGWIDLQQGMWLLESLEADGRVQCVVMPMNWERFYSRWSGQRIPSWLKGIAEKVAANQAIETNRPELLEILKETSPAEQFSTVLNHFTKIAAKTLGWKADEPPNTMRTLNELGFDSLTGVEYCNSVGKSIGVKLAPTVLFDYPTIRSLAEHVASDLLKISTESQSIEASKTNQEVSPAEVPTDQKKDLDAEVFLEVEAMSEEELAALINEQLATLEGA